MFLRQRTLVLHGKDDPIVPLVNARILAFLIRDATLHIVDDGHLFLISQPTEMAGLIGTFLSDDGNAAQRPASRSVEPHDTRSSCAARRLSLHMRPFRVLHRQFTLGIRNISCKIHYPPSDRNPGGFPCAGCRRALLAPQHAGRPNHRAGEQHAASGEQT
jgi:hypothetical protein